MDDHLLGEELDQAVDVATFRSRKEAAEELVAFGL
jgi:hypothetical protein